ncbi:hypothetical protein A9K97_gp039 [Tokyovirus A1]|uniref:hypothetical protein n=1 Tax=Tokyovirus A1 TaxID=1826170 RepID=UPI0007A96AD3|nr:hypothetical protein A9K97_gp039 [Tokyovirus A1]BAU80312.1 conserved hypothetical protein [Tokyovirus A1]
MQTVNVSFVKKGQKTFAEFDIVVKFSLDDDEAELYKKKEGTLERWFPFVNERPSIAIERSKIGAYYGDWDGDCDEREPVHIEGLILSNFLRKPSHEAIAPLEEFENWKKQQMTEEKVRQQKKRSLREERKRRK